MNPKTQNRLLWTARILELCGALAGGAGGYSVFTGGTQGWLALVAWALAMVAGRIRQWLPGADGAPLPRSLDEAKKLAGGGAIVLALAIVLGGAGCNKWQGLAAGYRTLSAVKRIGDTIDQRLAEKLRAETDKCVKAHGANTKEAKACVAPAVKRTRDWQVAAKGISAAALGARGALDGYFAHLAGEGGKGLESVIGVVKPVLCAASKAVLLFEQWIRIDDLLKTIRTVAQFTCPTPGAPAMEGG